MKIHAYTSFSYSYLARARVLAASIRRAHPDWVLWAVMTDCPPPGWQPDWAAEDFDHVIEVTDLFAPQDPERTKAWLFGHDIVEACTAVKGRALSHILARPDCAAVLYFDPDMAVFNPLDPVTEALGPASIILTPHQTDPEPRDAVQAIFDNEITSLQYGVFNLGFLAVLNDAEGRRFARWWEDRLGDWCHDTLGQGLFVDQKWCNLVPCLFDRVLALRDPGLNVASWNLSQREIRFDAEGCALVNGRPLRFFHFTKLGPVGDMMTQRYAGANTEVYELWHWYAQAVERATDPAIPKGWWAYGRFDNGDPVPKAARCLYRSRADLQAAFPDPFRSGPDSFQDWWVHHEAGGEGMPLAAAEKAPEKAPEKARAA